MNGNIVETLVGAVVLAVAAGFLWFAVGRADVGSVSGYELSARFQNINGINVGSDVMVGGIKVGTVVNQHLDAKSFEAVLIISVRDDLQLPLDSSIRIATAGLLGGNFLTIDPGADEEMMTAGDEFEFTQSAIDLSDLISRAVHGASSGANSK
jgi:phospholipid/cholesterol/gamma-HCH transport system substrate-binding protein